MKACHSFSPGVIKCFFGETVPCLHRESCFNVGLLSDSKYHMKEISPEFLGTIVQGRGAFIKLKPGVYPWVLFVRILNVTFIQTDEHPIRLLSCSCCMLIVPILLLDQNQISTWRRTEWVEDFHFLHEPYFKRRPGTEKERNWQVTWPPFESIYHNPISFKGLSNMKHHGGYRVGS
jgi:hypothetical protein